MGGFEVLSYTLVLSEYVITLISVVCYLDFEVKSPTRHTHTWKSLSYPTITTFRFALIVENETRLDCLAKTLIQGLPNKAIFSEKKMCVCVCL